VASGDLSHVGPAFGGQPLTPATRTRLRSADEGLLERMSAGDGEGFYRSIRNVQDRNNVCGVTPGYLTLKILGEGVRGERLAYETCPADEADRSAVTIGGVVFGWDVQIGTIGLWQKQLLTPLPKVKNRVFKAASFLGFPVTFAKNSIFAVES
jgi:hypothetical protein